MSDSTVITDIGIKRFCYCPRWYYLDYIMGFHPRTPVKAKFIINDALTKIAMTRNAADFMERCTSLARSEEIVEENVPLEEMLERGELLSAELMKWLASAVQPTWQEQLARYAFEDIEGVILESFPKLVATKNGGQTLFQFRTAYETCKPMDMLGYVYPALVQLFGLTQANIQVDRNVVVAMVVRTRKERYSNRAKTPLVEISEHELILTDHHKEQMKNVVVAMKQCHESGTFPATGVVGGTCVWCPNGRLVQDKMLCEYPDDIIKDLRTTSLQRVSIERWRDEF